MEFKFGPPPSAVAPVVEMRRPAPGSREAAEVEELRRAGADLERHKAAMESAAPLPDLADLAAAHAGEIADTALVTGAVALALAATALACDLARALLPPPPEKPALAE